MKEDYYIDLIKKVLTASIYEESSWRVVVYNKHNKTFLTNPIDYLLNLRRSLMVKVLNKWSLVLIKRNSFVKELRDKGRDMPFFAYTMIGHRRLDNIEMCVEDVIKNNIPGDLIETGVWRGGATILMRALLKKHGITDRKVWVADSFEGMPVPKNDGDGGDFSQNEYFSVSLEQVKYNFERFGLLDEQVEFLKGWFSDTLPSAPIEKLAVLRLDGDMYSSTMDSLNSLYYKVSKGGYVIIDDYYSWPSCQRAVTDFLAKNSIKPEIRQIDDDGAYWKCE